jgi:ATP-dependent DNA ligase
MELVKPNSASSRLPDFVEPMKVKLVDSIPTGNWIYEIKFDGYRALALRGAVKPVSCRGTKRI